MVSSAALFLATASLAASATIPVSVGKTGLTFEPNVIRASVGDVIEFQFYARNHSVVSGDFTGACIPGMSGGFYSGFFPTQSGVNVRSPLSQRPTSAPDQQLTQQNRTRSSASRSRTPTQCLSIARKTRASTARTAW